MSLPAAEELIANLRQLGEEFSAEISGLATEQEIRLAQARYLGRKGRVTDLMKALGKIAPEDRPRVGEAANQVRDAIEGAVGTRLAALAEQALAGELARTVDVTLPARGHGQGTLHPLTLVRREIEGIFQGLGYEVRTGPWVETEWNNFDALNTPADHPARDMQDTFFVEAPAPSGAPAGSAASSAPAGGNLVLRSHTSPVQVRTMLAGPPPVKIIAPGNVFRRDDDATHTPMFPQVEGLYVDRDVSFEDLKATLIYFVRQFFGPAMNLRLRPSFFPFTEPSAEVDASCFQCRGEAPAKLSCRLCKGTGWIEIGGCGMVHPNVLKAVGYDKHDVTGFAFGMGLSRMAMLKYGINDLRLFYENDLRFLGQFKAGEGAVVKASLNWLRELLPPEAGARLDAAAAAQILTRVGLEVEGIEPRGHELGGVLVAEVLGIRPHPGADKLRLVRVRAGAREEEVVCGAANVPPPGNRVAWAAPGARLPGGKTLEAREVRGVMSPGMLCSEPELGIGEKGDGILILSPSDPSGVELTSHFGIRDDVLEVNVTPNRPDALSHLGIARELAAQLGVPVRHPPALDVKRRAQAQSGDEVRDVRIADGAGAPRYQARFATDLTVGPSPLAIRLRLAACGIRPISNLVDVTNWVLLELGHPLHAFDLEKISGGITVRRARPGEKLTTLDGVERALEPGDIVIADERGGVALGGVMGGASSEVSAGTRRVLLEAATFDPISIRRTSKRLGLISEASYRFERGVDAEGVPRAAARAADLLAQLGGGAVLDAVVDRFPQPVAPRTARLPMARLQRLSGLPISAEEAAGELRKISDQVKVEGTGASAVLALQVPSYRPDLALPEDLVEEILRLGGRYEAPPQIERVLANARSVPSPETPGDHARDLLAGAGLSEVVSWGFVPRASLVAVHPSLADGVTVKNPISADYEVMRTTLLPGLAAALVRNQSRGVADVRLFEVGPVVHPGSGPEPAQREQVALLMSGRSAGWLKPGEALDFFDLKRAVGDLLAGFGVEAEYAAATDVPFLHPGVAAALSLPGGRRLGVAGELHPGAARRLGLEVRAFYAELDLDPLAGGRGPARSVPPPRFPASTRDLSFWVDEGVPSATQRAAFLAAGEPLLRDVAVLEDFRDPRYAPAGKKGMLWTMTYRADDRTLTDAEADAAHAKVVAALSGKLTITVR